MASWSYYSGSSDTWKMVFVRDGLDQQQLEAITDPSDTAFHRVIDLPGLIVLQLNPEKDLGVGMLHVYVREDLIR